MQPHETTGPTGAAPTPAQPRTEGVESPELHYAPRLVEILSSLKASLLVSTYQAGKLAVCRAQEGTLKVSYPTFERPMGVAIAHDRIAVATFSQIWFLLSSPEIAPRITPAGTYDGCYLSRACHVTGEIAAHEMEWGQNELWIVNTLFSCLCTLSTTHNFVPRWKPSFISMLAAEDRCHLNGLAMENGRPRFVTCLGETDTPEGWRPGKVNGGCLIDVASGQVVLRGLYMPHSPRVYQGRVWVLESGRGRLLLVDPAFGKVETVAQLPGYARGLSFMGRYAFVGLSSIRQSAANAGLPIAEAREALKCGVVVVDLTTGTVCAELDWRSGVEEIFDVRLLSASRSPFFSGPFARLDGTHPVWLAAPPRFDLRSI